MIHLGMGNTIRNWNFPKLFPKNQGDLPPILELKVVRAHTMTVDIMFSMIYPVGDPSLVSF